MSPKSQALEIPLSQWLQKNRLYLESNQRPFSRLSNVLDHCTGPPWQVTWPFRPLQLNVFLAIAVDSLGQAQEMTACEEKEKEDEEAKEAALRAAYGPPPPGPHTAKL